MNRSSSSSSPTLPPLPYRPTSVATTATRLTPAVIPLEYNYNIMSPSTYTNTLSRPRSTQRESFDSGNLSSFHYSSIFGDPVPSSHPVEFLGAHTENGSHHSSQLFPALHSRRNFDILSSSSIPRLKPPDIQILTHSSAESGSEPLDSPNFSLLRPENIPPALYENITPVDVDEVLETVTISDATGVREYTEAKRRVSNISEDFRSNVGITCHKDSPTASSCKHTSRRGSNDSYSSEDWFRPATRDFPEFSKMPKLRPSSKNIMQIKNSEMPTQFSPVAAMFNDSSSGDEHLTVALKSKADERLPERPPAPSQLALEDLVAQQSEQFFFQTYPLADPPPLPPPPPMQKTDSMESMARLVSPAIKTNLIATGGDHRLATPRLHKKTSFTILPDKSQHSSRATTPTTPIKPVAKPRYHLPAKSMSSTQLKLPHIAQLNQFTSDDSPRPSVQFDMTGRYSPIKVPAKGILQHRESLSSSQDAIPQTHRRFSSTLPEAIFPYGHKHRSYEALPLITDPYRTSIPRLNRSAFDINREQSVFPPGALPRPLRPNPNPTRKHKGLLRVMNREEVLSRIPLRSNWTSMDDLVMKRGRGKPMLQRRRSSSTSPERRSSTQTGSDRRSSNLSSITTSDFSFRRPSLIGNNNNNNTNFNRRNSMIKAPITPKRRQSVVAKNAMGFGRNNARTKIAKPTTLSPIIGTPNKDSSTPQSPVRMMLPTGPTSESFSDTSRRDSLSKIPVRRGSQSSSRVASRAGSPTKELTVQLPTSGRTSQATSYRSLSRGSLKIDSRSPSRSNSRASTRPISQLQSRSSSRQSSRMEQSKYNASSRSTSRASLKSTPRTTHPSLSPPRRIKATPTAQRKSYSLSPQTKTQIRRGTNKAVTSPTKSRNREKSASKRNSRSRIPRRASVTSGSSKSPTKAKQPVLRNKRSSPVKLQTNSKPKVAASAKKATSSAKKPESSVKRTPSAVVKQKAGTNKEPNVTKKTEKDMKKETMKKVPVKKEVTTQKKSSAVTKPAAEKPKPEKPLKKTPSTRSLSSKTAAENSKKMASDELKSIGANARKLGAIGTVAAGTAVAAAIASSGSEDTEAETAKNMEGSNTAGNMKRSPSSTTLMRMGSRMSLFTKKRPDSSLGRRITEEELSDNSITQAQQGTNLPLTPEAAAILEKSQRTLEDVQKTVSVATDEIHKTINTNLTDLKTLEMEAGKSLTAMVEEGVSTAASVATVIEQKTPTQSVTPAAEVKLSASPMPSGPPIEAEVSVINKEPKKNGASERVSARAISVLPEVESESANLQNFELDVTGKSNAAMAAAGVARPAIDVANEPQSDDFKVEGKRRSPDGQGGSAAGSGEKTGSQEEFLRQQESDEETKGCCGVCNKFCMPCRRARCSQCCRRQKSVRLDESEDTVISATSSATTTHLEHIDEKSKKGSCWPHLLCCKRAARQPQSSAASTRTMEMKEETMHSLSSSPPKQSKCGLCISKIFCCRSVNRVNASTGDETQVQKCCFCIPCRGKRRSRTPPLGSATSSVAWQDAERAISPTDASVLEGITTERRDGCCKRFCCALFCCCRKKQAPVAPGSRRQSIKPPPEDTRRKLHVDLVEFNSKMKGAIPVLPLYLAWFCAICNTLVPGLGTLLSGFFCVCIGIPRFSHYDSAKARFGSFIINIIVACAQLFCVLFCFVGWGWSIWWGTIMLKCAKKFSKIKKVERLEMEDERRQQQIEAEALANAARNAANAEITETTKT